MDGLDRKEYAYFKRREFFKTQYKKVLLICFVVFIVITSLGTGYYFMSNGTSVDLRNKIEETEAQIAEQESIINQKKVDSLKGYLAGFTSEQIKTTVSNNLRYSMTIDGIKLTAGNTYYVRPSENFVVTVEERYTGSNVPFEIYSEYMISKKIDQYVTVTCPSGSYEVTSYDTASTIVTTYTFTGVEDDSVVSLAFTKEFATLIGSSTMDYKIVSSVEG